MKTAFTPVIHTALIVTCLALSPMSAAATEKGEFIGKPVPRSSQSLSLNRSKPEQSESFEISSVAKGQPLTQPGTCYWIARNKSNKLAENLRGMLRGSCKKITDQKRGTPAFLPGQKIKRVMVHFYNKGLAQP